jgi:hypothetical protein
MPEAHFSAGFPSVHKCMPSPVRAGTLIHTNRLGFEIFGARLWNSPKAAQAKAKRTPWLGYQPTDSSAKKARAYGLLNALRAQAHTGQ